MSNDPTLTFPRDHDAASLATHDGRPCKWYVHGSYTLHDDGRVEMMFVCIEKNAAVNAKWRSRPSRLREYEEAAKTRRIFGSPPWLELASSKPPQSVELAHLNERSALAVADLASALALLPRDEVVQTVSIFPGRDDSRLEIGLSTAGPPLEAGLRHCHQSDKSWRVRPAGAGVALDKVAENEIA